MHVKGMLATLIESSRSMDALWYGNDEQTKVGTLEPEPGSAERDLSADARSFFDDEFERDDSPSAEIEPGPDVDGSGVVGERPGLESEIPAAIGNDEPRPGED